MHTDEPRPNPLTDLGYETEDLHMPSIGKGAWIFFIFVFAMIGIGGLLFWWMDGFGLSHVDDRKAPFLTKVPASPNPLLQGNVTTKTDLIDLRNAENNALAVPAYVDQVKGIIRIPIDHAIDLTVQKLQSPGGGPGSGMSSPTLDRVDSPISSPSSTIPLASPSPEGRPNP